MTRTLSATITTAIAEETTRPIYLIDMAWDTPVKAAQFDSSITWNSQTWIASGIEITGLSASGGTMTLPMGDADPWLALVIGEIPRNRTISIYEHQTNYTVSPNVSDAQLLFSGYMDAATVTNKIKISLLEGALKKAFPNTDIDRPTYTYLLPSGTRLRFGTDLITVN